MKILTAVALMVVLGGCAASTRPAPSAGAQTFAGEVWTWDDKESTVMLIQEDGRPVRVKTTPDQMRTLRLHSFARITGTPAPPADVVIMTGTSGPVTAVPKAPAEIVELKGAVAAVGPGGRLVVNSDRGPVHVWVAPGPEQRFKVGDPVSVSASVQPVDLVPAAAAASPAPAPVGGAAASPSSEPGDHAVVTGRVMGINPGGILVVESPTGPIQVTASDVSRYRVGDAVQVRTTVVSAR
jgi:hypothetical protein